MLGILNSVTHGSAILKDLVIVSTLVGLVAKEVDGRVIDTTDGLLGLEVLQTIGFIPAIGEDVEGYLTTNGKAVMVGVSR